MDLIKLFTLLSRSTLTSDCKVSLPKKTSLWCRIKRFNQRTIMKAIWKLTENPFGFMVLDRKPCLHLLGTFLDPFTRFNLEGYLQTAVPSDLTHIVYNFLVKLIPRESVKHDSYVYGFLSKYFEVVSKFKGVSTVFYSWIGLIWNLFLRKQHFSIDQKKKCTKFDKFFSQPIEACTIAWEKGERIALI